MKEKCKLMIAVFAMAICLPYLITLFISGRQACPMVAKVDIEDYLPAIVGMEIPSDYSEDSILAQAIISRTNLYLAIQEGTASDIVEKASEYIKRQKVKGNYIEKLQVCQNAVQKTKGKILTYQGKVCEVPYHRISGGKTRNGSEALGEDYSYLPSVETKSDLDSQDFLKGFYFTPDELAEKLKVKYAGFSWGDEISDSSVQIVKADSADYALEVQLGNEVFQGEEIRQYLGLTSSCFTIQNLGNQIRFLCKGVGHGVGLSQFTANVMGKDGTDYIGILSYFFPDLVITELSDYELKP